MDRQIRSRRRAPRRQLLEDQCSVEPCQLRSADVAIHIDARKAQRGRLGERRVVDLEPGGAHRLQGSELAAGLEIKKFRPAAEEKKGFYAELPIALEVSGSYHQLATFISGIAALPRIVTISEMKLEPLKTEEANSAKLKMTAIAKTYRYLQEDEQ